MVGTHARTCERLSLGLHLLAAAAHATRRVFVPAATFCVCFTDSTGLGWREECVPGPERPRSLRPLLSNDGFAVAPNGLLSPPDALASLPPIWPRAEGMRLEAAASRAALPLLLSQNVLEYKRSAWDPRRTFGERETTVTTARRPKLLAASEARNRLAHLLLLAGVDELCTEAELASALQRSCKRRHARVKIRVKNEKLRESVKRSAGGSGSNRASGENTRLKNCARAERVRAYSHRKPNAFAEAASQHGA